MRTRTWEKIYDAPHGQRFFVLLIDGEREAIPRVSRADAGMGARAILKCLALGVQP